MLAASLAGIFGLGAWNLFQIHRNAIQSHARWVSRLSDRVMAERQNLTRRVNDLPEDINEMRQQAEEYPSVVAIFRTNHLSHQTKRWVRDSVRSSLETIDPRLVALELKSLETGTNLPGPVLFIDGVAHETVVRPLDRQHALIIYMQNPEITRVFQQETPPWQVHTFVYDYEGHPIYLSNPSPVIESMIDGILNKVRTGTFSGQVKWRGKEAWHWLVTFRYDPLSDWTFVVTEPLPWAYAPFLSFVIGLTGVMMLAGFSWRSASAMSRQWMSRQLRQYGQRVDKFIFSKEATLNDPPPELKELTSVAKNLRWLVPEWEKAESLSRGLDLDRKLLSLLVESLPEGILFFSAEGHLQLSNELGRAFLTLNQETGHEHRTVGGIQIPRGYLEPFLEPVFTGKQKNLGKEVETTWAENKYLYRLWVESVETKEGTVDGFFVVIRDITFRKQWEHVQEQMMSGITHDLRGPLSAIMGYIDLARRQIKDDQQPKAAEYMGLAREAGVRLTRMVSDILDVVRFEQGNIELQPQAIAIREIFERLENFFTVMAQQKQVQMKLECDDVQEESVWGDPKLLERVFDNLVGNAIKFTPSGGKVTVAAQRGQGRMIFEVMDTGRGIPREAQSRIFDKFQQVRPGDRSAGYGLGLAVVKFIVEAHKGDIRVESEIGHGSRFTFWIPNAQEKPEGPGISETTLS
jgi:signal transduction histidine kinase